MLKAFGVTNLLTLVLNLASPRWAARARASSRAETSIYLTRVKVCLNWTRAGMWTFGVIAQSMAIKIARA